VCAFLFEQAVLNGIDKGEIISSSAPQVPKDGRSSSDFTHTRRMKPGSAPFQGKFWIYIYILLDRFGCRVTFGTRLFFYPCRGNYRVRRI